MISWFCIQRISLCNRTVVKVLRGPATVIVTVVFLLVTGPINGLGQATPPLAAAEWLKKWQTFSADYSSHATGTTIGPVPKGASIAGGRKLIFHRGRIAVVESAIRFQNEEVSRIDLATDKVHLSFGEQVIFGDATLAVNKTYDLATLTNEDLSDGDPFRYLQSEDDSQQISISYDKPSSRWPVFIPNIMSSDNTKAVADPIIQKILQSDSVEWRASDQVAAVDCSEATFRRKGEIWRVQVCPENGGAIMSVQRTLESTMVDSSGRSLSERGIRSATNKWEIAEFAPDWSRFVLRSSSRVDYANGASRVEESTQHFKNIVFSVDKSALKLSFPIANGSSVIISNAQHIKAVWRDGKIVRVYNNEAVETLADVSFAAPKPGLLRWWPAAIGICVGIAIIYITLVRRRATEVTG